MNKPDKKLVKLMINGWRARPELSARFEVIEREWIEKYGKDYVKAELMDCLFDAGMSEYKRLSK